MARKALSVALIAGLLGGLVSSLCRVGPALMAAAPNTKFTDYAGLLAALLALHMGLRACARARGTPSYASRLVDGSLIVIVESVVLGLALYLLYAVFRPGLLMERYGAYVAGLQASGLETARVLRALADLGARKAQYLDPVFQAVEGAGTLFFAGMLLSTYLAFRARVAERLARGRPARTP